MKAYKTNIGGESFTLAVADTEETRKEGLSNLSKLGKLKGMLFIFPEKGRHSMTMKDMDFGLDFLFVNDDWTVGEFGTRRPKADDIVSVADYSFVIELAEGSIKRLKISEGSKIEPSEDLKIQAAGVKMFKHGGRFEMVGEKIYEIKAGGHEVENGRLQLLDNEGRVALNIDGGARIFSREDTEELMRLQKEGTEEELAQFMIQALNKQDAQQQEYVTK